MGYRYSLNLAGGARGELGADQRHGARRRHRLRAVLPGVPARRLGRRDARRRRLASPWPRPTVAPDRAAPLPARGREGAHAWTSLKSPAAASCCSAAARWARRCSRAGSPAGSHPAAVTVLEPSPSPRLEALAGRGLRLNGAPPRASGRRGARGEAADRWAPPCPGLRRSATARRSSSPSPPARRSAPSRRRSASARRSCGRCRTPRPRSAAASPRSSATPMSTPRGLALAETLMQAVGQHRAVLDDEAQMDAVTAVSGSGPAYVFLMIEALAAAGEAEGLDAGFGARARPCYRGRRRGARRIRGQAAGASCASTSRARAAPPPPRSRS